MEETRTGWKPNPVFSSMPHSMGRGSREEIVWEALDRVSGKPAPTMGAMQAAMALGEAANPAPDPSGRQFDVDVGRLRRPRPSQCARGP